MDIPKKRLNSGFEMPVYGLGTWRMGGANERESNNDDAADVWAIESAVEHGVRHIDTAEKYANGHAEVLVGQAIKRFDRDNIFLATKFGAEHAARDDVVKSCEASLRRMKVNWVDLYLLHSFAHNVALLETLDAMASLVERELVRNIGVSNFGTTNLENALAIASVPIVVNQVHYNVAVREVEAAGLLQSCQDNDVFLAAWRPVRFGGLAESDVIKELAEKYNKTATQVAINWLVSQDHVITLARTRSDAHLEENLGALDWTMQDADVEFLRSEYPNQVLVSDAVPLDS